MAIDRHSATVKPAHPGVTQLTDDLGILFGGDYNPEQWPASVWREDVALMKAAGVNLVTVGVFSWARYEPSPGVRDFAWLDEVLGLLHEAGIAVDLATPTASPPPWLGHQHPQTLPVMDDGSVLTYGSRNQFNPSSSAYRSAALAITTDLVARYASHPAVRMWHIGNEYGQIDFGPESAAAFQDWLKARYGSLAALNQAWATLVWSQQYSSWDEVIPPRAAPYHRNPSLELDFKRFTSHALLALYREQYALIRSFDSERPITTNFMGFFHLVDYASWAGDVDIVADDSYPDAANPRVDSDTALVQDLMRSLGGGKPWMLMEQATSAVTFRPHNLTKTPARSRLESLQAVARGCDGICFFQWRAARTGPERFHSAMLPHAGADTALHRGVAQLGGQLANLRTVVGSGVEAPVALVFDWTSWWARGQSGLPTDRLDAVAALKDYYRPLWEAGIAVDVVEPTADLSGYGVVIAPSLYVLTEAGAANLTAYREAGGHLVIGAFSAVADQNAHVRQGRFPVLLRDLLGVSGEEWLPLPDGGAQVSWVGEGVGAGEPGASFAVATFAERLRTDGAEVIASFVGGELDGLPAITRRSEAEGGAGWYVGAVLPAAELTRLLTRVLADAGVRGVLPGLPAGVEVTRRGPALFVLNHTRSTVDLDLEALLNAVSPTAVAATDLLTGTTYQLTSEATRLQLFPDDVVVLTERS